MNLQVKITEDRAIEHVMDTFWILSASSNALSESKHFAHISHCLNEYQIQWGSTELEETASAQRRLP